MTNNLPIAEDPSSKHALELARRAANSKATILITGETGVGKELIARFIHENSPFSEGPFVSINCAALPENMMEAILFGYEKGAFTNAINSYTGKFEQANGGTLLLDEVAEIPLFLQAKLLRVLQEREIERLGSTKIIPIQTRIIAATNRNLQVQVESGLFRSDLFYRLNVLQIHYPALRERILDILPCAEYFINKYAEDNNKITLTEKAKSKLLRYDWPGNVREIENVIQRAIVINNKNIIDEEDIHLQNETNTFAAPTPLKANEAKVIIDVLNEANGNRSITAKKLNISQRTLRYKLSKIKSYGVKIP